MSTTKVTPAVRAKAEDNLRKARVQLVLHQPFFASIALRRKITIDDNTPTAFITPQGEITLGTAFTASLSVQNTAFVLAHEAMHYAMLHHVRVGARNKRAANIAMDKVINDLLIEEQMTPPENGVYQQGASAYAWEQLYQEPTDEERQQQGDYTAGEGTDDLGDGPAPDAQQVEEIKQELAQAAQAAKAQGKLPVGVSKLVQGIINPPTPWFQLLERFMLYQVKDGVSFRRPNKRFMCHDLYMPSHDVKPRLGTVVIQVDESGSIGADELAHFSGHANRIIEMCNPERVIVLHTSSHVAKVEEFTTDDLPIKFKQHTTGGTDMPAGIRWCIEEGIEPDVFVCLTDGYTPWGTPPMFPVAWLITSHQVAPYGETIHYEVHE